MKTKFMPNPLRLYIVGWIFFVYLFTQILNFTAANSGNILLSGLYFVEFGVHEASHLAVFFLPAIFVAAAGSIGEIAFTFLILFATIKAKAYFAAVFASLWIMLAMRNVGLYIADARAQAIPLIGPGENVQHDWNYILGQLGWLEYDKLMGNIVIWVGVAIGVLGLQFGLYLIIMKIYLKHKAVSVKA
ncbi:MAG: hypothetical protein V4611_03815 [Patescibacteria group bacterium]